MVTDTIKTLQLLKQIRGREVSELTGQLSQKKQVRQRYQRNIDALTSLSQMDAPPASAALMANQSVYKNHLQRLINWQKQEFVLADKEVQGVQQELTKEACREKTVDLVLEQQNSALRLEQDRRQQKITDNLSTQCWLRNKALAAK